MEENDEMKESLNSMFKGGKEDAKLAAGIITANPDLVPLKDIWYNINDLISKDTVRYVEMYCREGSHDKVYIVVVNSTPKQSWNYRTIAYYGRRGKNLVKKDYGSSYTRNEKIDSIIGEKTLKKGYTIINEA